MAYLTRARDEGSSLGSFLSGAFAGMLLGGVLGVMLAPHRGDITRRKLMRKADEAREQVGEAMEDQLEAMRTRKQSIEHETEGNVSDESEVESGDQETDN